MKRKDPNKIPLIGLENSMLVPKGKTRTCEVMILESTLDSEKSIDKDLMTMLSLVVERSEEINGCIEAKIYEDVQLTPSEIRKISTVTLVRTQSNKDIARKLRTSSTIPEQSIEDMDKNLAEQINQFRLNNR